MIKQLDDCLLFQSRVFEHKLNKLAEIHFNEFGFHMTYAYILKVIYFKEKINPKELADILYVLPSTITRMVNKLIEEDLIIQGDGQSKKILMLSQKGEQLIPDLLNAWEKYHQDIEQEFGPELSKQLHSNLRKANQ